MKVICTQENLKAGLATVGRIISSSSTLPILNNVLVKTDKGLLKVSSTNLEVAIITHIRCKVEDAGDVTVACKTISDLVSNLPNKNIILETKENSLAVETENYHTTIKTLPAEEFPLIPNVEGRDSLKLKAQEIKTALDQVVFASATNQTQPEITGVLFGFDDKGLRVVATDRYRLAEKKIFFNCPINRDAIIPHKTALELSRVIGNQEGDVEIVLSETQVSFTFLDTQIISRLVDGQYPPYEQIIPQKFPLNADMAKKDLVNALRAGGIFSQSSNSVKMDFNPEKGLLVITSESSELGKSVVEIPSHITGPAASLILNYHYILDCLQNIEAETVKIKVVDDNSPSLLVPEDRNDYIYLIMPIKT